MIRMKRWMAFLVLSLSLAGGLRAETDEAMARRRAWFNDAKFGFIVHYSLFSLGPHEGVDPYECNLLMRKRNRFEPGYETFADRFKATKFAPHKWLTELKSAGGRYVTFTTKNHDGFCLFGSKLTDFDCVDHGAGRDLIRELVEAARAAEIKIVLYYSMLDWHQGDYHGNLPRYVDFMHGQVKELCTSYGPIDGVWFDGEWDHPFSAWRSAELVQMIRRLQGGAVINDRLGKGERGVNRLCDFYTREQMNEIGKPMDFEKTREVPWEACMTIGDSWVYRKDDTKLKQTETLIRRIVDVVSRGGNFLLNVGLTADGEIPAEYLSRLRGIGRWLAVNGESIYGTRRSPFRSLPAGKCTTKGSRLYVHLESHPGRELRLLGLQNTIRRAWLLKTGARLAFDDDAKTIVVGERLTEEPVCVVAIELDSEPRVK